MKAPWMQYFQQALRSVCSWNAARVPTTSLEAHDPRGHSALTSATCAAAAALLFPRTQVRMDLVERLADIEYRLAFGTSERLQLGSLVGGFSLAKEEIVAAAK
jgi:hypothetical protein